MRRALLLLNISTIVFIDGPLHTFIVPLLPNLLHARGVGCSRGPKFKARLQMGLASVEEARALLRPAADLHIQIGPLPSEHGTYETVKARFWPRLSPESPSNNSSSLGSRHLQPEARLQMGFASSEEARALLRPAADLRVLAELSAMRAEQVCEGGAGET